MFTREALTSAFQESVVVRRIQQVQVAYPILELCPKGLLRFAHRMMGMSLQAARPADAHVCSTLRLLAFPKRCSAGKVCCCRGGSNLHHELRHERAPSEAGTSSFYGNHCCRCCEPIILLVPKVRWELFSAHVLMRSLTAIEVHYQVRHVRRVSMT